VRRASDAGKPLVLAAPDSVPARAVNAIAEKIETLMAARPAAAESQPKVTF
jgi:MinD-like ATPase involved in chromosome partitioning or flagellar assembly